MATAIEQVKIAPVNMKERQELGIKPGDTVKVHQKIQDKGKTRIQVFDGLVLATKHGGEPGATFTVRKVSSGVGVEKIFPLYSPQIDKIEIVKRAKVRRAKLYYIREKVARQVKRQMRRMSLVSMGTESEIEASARREAEEAEAAEKAAQAESEAQQADVAEKTAEVDATNQETATSESETKEDAKSDSNETSSVEETETKDEIAPEETTQPKTDEDNQNQDEPASPDADTETKK